jgi:hypothetical protein
VREPGALWKVENTLGLVVGLANLAPACARLYKLLLSLGEFVVSVAKENKTEYRDGVFGRLQFGVGAHFIDRVSQASFDFVVVSWHVRRRLA